MGLTFIEKLLARHSDQERVRPDEIIDIEIDVRVARDFGGANVVNNLRQNGLELHNPAKTYFTFDCNPTGSDQKYAANQQYCRLFAREQKITVFDIDAGIGTHLMIEKGIAVPGSTLISTDSHANILGAIGAFGQGMGDQDIAAAWARGKSWFKVPPSVKIQLTGRRPTNVYAKDIVLNLLHRFGASQLLGSALELYGEEVEKLSLDERITISSMATEMGAIIVLFTPSDEIMAFAEERAGHRIEKITADADAHYAQSFELDCSRFVPMLSRPGHPDDAIDIQKVKQIKIDSAFIGSCTNGRYSDMVAAAAVLKNRKIAPGVVLKIVPATDAVWQQLLNAGLIKIFKEAGALVSNAGCAGCAAGQVGMNGPDEVSVSTGNRNFAGKQGAGQVYLGSPAAVAASAVAGYLTSPDEIPATPTVFTPPHKRARPAAPKKAPTREKPLVIEGKVWLIAQDNIDTDMIFHNRYLTITDIDEMGRYTFDNLTGWEDFAQKAQRGDILISAKNFGAGSSRQQAVDCFKSLGVQAILAASFGAIYERNAINAAFPILTYEDISPLELEQRDEVRIDFSRGILTRLKTGKTVSLNAFSKVQLEIYQRDGLLNRPS